VRVYGPSGSRSTPTDRNPATIIQSAGSSVGVGGIGDTTLITYTVPAGRRALLTCSITASVDIGPLAAGQLGVCYMIVASAGTGAPRLNLGTNTPSGTHEEVTVPGIQVAAGQTQQVHYSLNAGAGTMSVSGLITGVEYDA